MTKQVASAIEAVSVVSPGSSVMIGGFAVIHGWPNSLLRALVDRGIGDLTIIGNTLGFGTHSPQLLAEHRLVRRFIGTFGGFVGRETASEQQILAGEIDFEIVPQGTLVERMRAAGAGIAAFYTPTGAGTIVDTPEKEAREFDGQRYLLERGLSADVALLRAAVADEEGNLVFEGPQRNFQVAMATAARHVIAEVERIVPTGSLRPDDVHVPGIFVDAVVLDEMSRDEIMGETFALGRDPTRGTGSAPRTLPGLTRELMALRTARLIAERGYRYVNLGIGLPTLVGEWLAGAGADAVLHAQNGLLGYVSQRDLDDWDPAYYNAGGQPVAPVAESSTFDSVMAFTMARGGHLDAVILGAFEVSAAGDLANWRLPDTGAGGIGGAMDLVAGHSPVVVVMEHTTRDGSPRIVEQCTAPLTGERCVDTIVTNLAVIDRTADGMVLREIAPGVTTAEVVAATGCPLHVPGEIPVMSM